MTPSCLCVLSVLLSLTLCGLVTSHTLYSASDPLTQLDVTSFSRTLTDSDTAWIVEFYAAWCGHCRRFAPIYKQYAADVQDWSAVIRVAAVACSDTRNQPVCRQQDVRSFPTVKFFPPNLASVTRGFKVNDVKPNVESMRNVTIDLIEEYVMPSEKRPKIKRFSSLDELRTPGAWPRPHHVLAIVEDETAPEDVLSKQVILDVSGLRPEMVVGRILRSSLPDPSLIWQPLPALVAVGETSVRFITQVTDREQTVDMITSISSGPPIAHHSSPTHSPAGIPSNQGVPLQPVPLQPSPQQPGVPLRQPQQSGHPHLQRPASVPANRPVPLVTQRPSLGPHEPSTPAHQQPIAGTGSGQSPVMRITQEDLDSNLYYSLWNEVPARRSVRGRALSALKEYVHTLQQHHPGNERTRSFLTNLNSWLQRIGGSLSSELYLNTIDGLQTENSYVAKDAAWRSCAGSDPRYRGYPCSLWMTFHALTVSAYKRHLQTTTEPFNPLEVLNVIRNYVKYFFGCRECSEHFLAMSKRMSRDISRPQDGVLWLWRAHNRVNNRLHGDSTEDPRHPKVQFPDVHLCPTCRVNNKQPLERYDNDTLWNEDEVLRFLMDFYSASDTDSHQQRNGQPVMVTQRPVTARMAPTRVPTGDTPGTLVNRQSNLAPTVLNTSTCVPMETPWSACSVTCGVGVSTRFTNHNSDCQMRMDMRICTLRKCDKSLLNFISRTGMSPSRCARYASSVLETSPRTLTFNNCTTTSTRRWRYCGLCHGYCCEPTDTETVWLDLECDDGHEGQAQFMWINRCRCRGGARRSA